MRVYECECRPNDALCENLKFKIIDHVFCCAVLVCWCVRVLMQFETLQIERHLALARNLFCLNLCVYEGARARLFLFKFILDFLLLYVLSWHTKGSLLAYEKTKTNSQTQSCAQMSPFHRQTVDDIDEKEKIIGNQMNCIKLARSFHINEEQSIRQINRANS